MPLSWNEIKSRAIAFSTEWKDITREEAEAKPFLIEFLNVFGISRKRVATFEHRVKKIDKKSGYIDLLWPGMLLVEMKSKGQDLEKAYQQAKEYCHGLKDHELPKQIMISDFETFHVYNETGEKTVFKCENLVDYIQVFADIAGYQKRSFKEQDPVNIEAAELMGTLHDKLKEVGYTGHELELYLVRLLFILFADDTNIFERGTFLDYLEQRTGEDGSDLGLHLEGLFSVLNTPEDKRLRTLDEQRASFPYVNGKLFEEKLQVADFDVEMRQILLDCCRLDWGKISPAIFGSLFQSVMDEEARRNLGAHYTSEKNIMKVIKPLFLDDLHSEFMDAGSNKQKLHSLHSKISKLKFLDPACGCGNFLIISYRELRMLELEIVKKLLGGQTVTNISHYFLVDVDQFYGIEYEEFPSQIAQVAMWLIDHQMNMLASQTFGEYMPRIPLKKSAVIVHGNALRIEWQSLISTRDELFSYILGNPPFLGKQVQSQNQKNDMETVFSGVKNAGVLDYVAAWYLRSAEYLSSFRHLINKTCKVAFVSTNSISQGEQVGVLWQELFTKHNIKIHFAHRTFKWGNEARGNAAVHVVIIGFSNYDTANKLIFDYEDIQGEPHMVHAKNINPYLVEGRDLALLIRKRPINSVPEMFKGSQPTDDGNLLMTNEEKEEFVLREPQAAKFIKPFISAKEFLHNQKRWCFWLVDVSPNELKHCPNLVIRVEAVKQFRLKSSKAATVKWAQMPTLFTENRQPNTDYVLIPSHSSEKRKYIPFGFMTCEDILNNSCFSIPKASKFHFGVLSSIMHMKWVEHVCGRLESRYRYSSDIVYNNFPWPLNPSEKQKESVEKAAQEVLDVRLLFQDCSLAELYDPITMPPALLKAHQNLDKSVDNCYRPQAFPNDVKRVEFLFDLYEKYTADLFSESSKNPKKRYTTRKNSAGDL